MVVFARITRSARPATVAAVAMLGCGQAEQSQGRGITTADVSGDVGDSGGSDPSSEDADADTPDQDSEGTDGDGGSQDQEGDEGTSTGGGDELSCTFTFEPSVSEVIPTVGIVEWSVDVELEAAYIEFGLDSDYELRAPVDLADEDLRTLLLGMKPARTYGARIVVDSPQGRCRSQAFELTTGPLHNGLPQLEVHTPQPEAAAEDYIVDGIWQTGPAFILDGDGDYVWWYGEGRTNRARMGWQGRWMYIMGTAMGGSDGSIYRVRMDGSEVEHFDRLDGVIHHDFTVLPEGGIAFIAKNDDGSDSVRELGPDGEQRVVIEVLEAHGGDGPRSHANALHYLPGDSGMDSFTVSDLSQNCYVHFSREGQVHWVLGGTTSDFTGDGANWNRQHGHHLIDATHFLMFNNNSAGDDSVAFEVELDHEGGTATRIWEYQAGLNSNVHGDVQRLANGNTSITYSVPGIIHEVAPDGSLVRELSWSLGGALGYSSRRSSLYGPPDVP